MTIEGCVMKKMDSAPRSPLSRTSVPLYQPHGRYVLPSRKAAPARSVTRAEIDHFWMRKKLEEEEHQLAAEKEAARFKVKTLKQEDYMLFEQMINGIIDETNERDKMRREGDITKNSKVEAVVTRNIEIRIGVKDWWRKSSYAYLNEPVVTSMDENSTWKDTMANISQNIYFGRCSPAPYQTNTTAFGIFEVMIPRLM